MTITCTTCNGRVFSTAAAYDMHVKTSKAHFVYTCTICSAQFPSIFARSGHLSKTHQDLLCRQCNRYYMTQESLQKHYKEDPAHPSCPQCGKGFGDAMSLGAHRVVEHPKPQIPCSTCNMAFETHAQLTQHWKDSIAHPSCIVCNEGFRGGPELNTHVRQAHPELWCGACMIGFQSAEQLLEHFMQSESSLHPTCTICDEGFESQAVFDEHVSSRHPPPPPTPPPPTPMSVQSVTSTIRCTQCDRTYRREEDILRHYKDSPAHPKCNPCSQGFADEEEYEDHVAEMHPQLASRSSQASTAKATPSSWTPQLSQQEIPTESSEDTTSPTAQTNPDHSSPITTDPLQFDIQQQLEEIRQHQHALYEQQLERNRVLSFQATAIRAAASSISSIRSAMSTPRGGSPWDFSAETQYATQSEVPFSPRTNVPEYDFKSREIQPSPMAQRASSEPTPTPPTPSEYPQPTPTSIEVQPPSRPASVIPPRAVVTPAISVQTLSYQSRTSTPERLKSPSSLASLCSPPFDHRTPSPSKLMSPLSSRSLRSGCRTSMDVHVPARTPSPPPSVCRAPRTPVSASATQAPMSRASASQPTVKESYRASPRAESRASSKPGPAVDRNAYSGADTKPEPSRAASVLSARQESVGSPRPLSSDRQSPLTMPVPSRPQTQSRASAARSLDPLNFPSSPEESDMNGLSGSSRTAATSPLDHPERRKHSERKPLRGFAPSPMLPKGLAWHCRLCMGEPHEPTVTVCGHLFCHGCIVQELAKNFQCPVCHKMMLVRLHVEDM